jgi:hypothetical protein
VAFPDPPWNLDCDGPARSRRANRVTTEPSGAEANNGIRYRACLLAIAKVKIDQGITIPAGKTENPVVALY